MNLRRCFNLLVALTASSTSFGVEWIFDHDKLQGAGGSVSWNGSRGGDSYDGYWYYLDSNGDRKYMRGSYENTDTFVLGRNNIYGKYSMAFNNAGGVTWGGLTLEGDSSNSIELVGVATNTPLTINGDINFNGGYHTLNYKELNVTGTLVNTSTNIVYLKSTKTNITGSIANSDELRRYFVEAGSSGRTLSDALTNGADFTLGGIAGNTNAFVVESKNFDRFISFGGFQGTPTLSLNQSSNGKNVSIIFKAAASINQGMGQISERDTGNGYDIASSTGKINIVMYGEGEQQLHNRGLLFTGGVNVKKGSMQIRFAQEASRYETTSTSAGYKTSYLTKDKSTATTFDHGDLVMEGGTFASTQGEDTYGSFRFKNIKYKGGEIALRLDGVGMSDHIDLTDYYRRDNLNGTITDTLQQGGTISLLEGATKVTFKITTSDIWYFLDCADARGIQIVAWESANKPNLTADNFAANDIDESGDLYTAKFTVSDDGLYINYLAAVVPEPSTYAAIAGFIALAFTIYRRRK